MTDQEIKTLLEKGYQPDMFQKYRAIYKQTFNQDASTCGCAANKIYNDIKKHFNLK